MTYRSQRHLVLAMATVFVLAMPSASLAGKGGGHSGGNGGPKESVNFNYGKTQTTYKAQTTSSKKGKAKFHDLSITHKNDKASP